MIERVHALAGGLALALVATFWSATVIAELFLGPGAIVWVKGAVVNGLWLLVLAMAAAGASGMRLARGRRAGAPLAATKARRMRVLAANGLLLMIPAALYLDGRARAGEWGAGFVVVQAIELAVGAVQVILLVTNLRDGRRLARRVTAEVTA